MRRIWGVTIVNRTKKGIIFTTEGEYLAGKSAQMLSLDKEIREHLRHLVDEPEQTLTIVASVPMGRFTLPGM